MDEGIYKNIVELQRALDNRVYDLDKVVGLCLDGGLVVLLKVYETPIKLFSDYYGSHKACLAICKLLGIQISEDSGGLDR